MLDQTHSEDHDVSPCLEEVPDGASFILVPTCSPKQPLDCLSVTNPLNWKKLATKQLSTSHTAVVTIYTIIAAFTAYFSIYGITQSLFAATFDGVKVFGHLDLKVAFSISQLLGYAISKVAGAIIIPTITRNRRWPLLLTLAILAVIPLILFGILPPAGQVFMVFLSALPMAWMWGIMVMYLEGRRTSEFLLMGLYLSVMVASGSAKSTAASVLKAGVPENWMPAFCASFAAVIFIFFISMLDAIPDPSAEDKKMRSERRTMTPAETRRFLVKWAPGLVFVTLVYAALTAFRNFRDYFAPELWRDLEGENFDPSVFTQCELPVGICTAVAYSLLYWIKDNKKAFFAILVVMFLGGCTILVATFIKTTGAIAPLPWMIMIGVGLYMAYIPPGAMLYDRFNGATGQPFTSVFMIYFSDVCGYSVTLTILLYKSFGNNDLPYLEFFQKLSFIASIACMIGMVIAATYFFFAMRSLSSSSSVPHIPLKEISLESGNNEEVKHEEEREEERERERNEKPATISFEVTNDSFMIERDDFMLSNAGVHVTAQAV